jgi:hypothetical protein
MTKFIFFNFINRSTYFNNFIYLVIFYILSLGNCALSNDVDIAEMQMDLNAATLLKVGECGTSPPFPIFKIGKSKPPEFGVRACTVAILLQSCPFTSYPLICLEYYKYDVPNIGPDLLK